MDNVLSGMARGLEAVGIADHGPRSAPWVGASVKQLRAMCREVREVDRRTVGLKVLAGAECNIASAKGDLDVPDEVLAELDVVLAGLHPGIRPRSSRDWFILTGANWAARLNPALRQRVRIQNTKAVAEAVRRNRIDVITHPGYGLDIDTTELARACAARDTAMEINARHHEMTVAYCRAAARVGARFVISSDAHSPAEVGNLSRGERVAAAAGLLPEQVLNSDKGDLFGWLERKRQGRAWQGGWADWAAQPASQQGRREREEQAGGRRESYWTDWADQGKVH